MPDGTLWLRKGLRRKSGLCPSAPKRRMGVKAVGEAVATNYNIEKTSPSYRLSRVNVFRPSFAKRTVNCP